MAPLLAKAFQQFLSPTTYEVQRAYRRSRHIEKLYRREHAQGQEPDDDTCEKHQSIVSTLVSFLNKRHRLHKGQLLARFL